MASDVTALHRRVLRVGTTVSNYTQFHSNGCQDTSLTGVFNWKSRPFASSCAFVPTDCSVDFGDETWNTCGLVRCTVAAK